MRQYGNFVSTLIILLLQVVRVSSDKEDLGETVDGGLKPRKNTSVLIAARFPSCVIILGISAVKI